MVSIPSNLWVHVNPLAPSLRLGTSWMTGRPPRIVPGAPKRGPAPGGFGYFCAVGNAPLGPCTSNSKSGFGIQVWGDDNSETWMVWCGLLLKFMDKREFCHLNFWLMLVIGRVIMRSILWRIPMFCRRRGRDSHKLSAFAARGDHAWLGHVPIHMCLQPVF
jgi:hypothetical protein